MNYPALQRATVGEAKTLCDKVDSEDRDFTPEEQARFDTLIEVNNKLKGEAMQMFSNPMTGADGKHIGPRPEKFAAGSAVQLIDEKGRCVRGLTKDESFEAAVAQQSELSRSESGQELVEDGLTLGGFLRAMVLGPSNNVERAALGGAGGATGGYTAPEVLSARLIDHFRARTHTIRLGAQTIPLSGDSHTFAKLTSDATAGWRRENTDVPISEPTFGGIVFYPKSLAVLVKVSRELLQDSLNMTSAIERSFAESFSVEIDRVGMFGEGAAEPVGVANTENINEIASVGVPEYSDILNAHKLLLDDNAPEPTGLIFSNREWLTYADKYDSTGQPLRRPMAIEGLPFAATSAVPTDQGAGSDESTMILGHWPDLMYGIRSELQIEVLKERFAEKHQYAFVAHMRMDTGVFHPESFCKLTGVTVS